MTISIKAENYKAAIFDMDGTMIANMAYHKQAWQEFLRRHAITLDKDEFRHKIPGKKNDQIFELVFGKKLQPAEEQDYTEEKGALYRELFKPHIAEIPGLTALLDELHKRGIKTAIATTAPAKNREFVLTGLGLQKQFEVILGDGHVSKGKPDPEIYELTAQRLGVAPNECLVFEDSPPGVISGKRASMTVVGIVSSHKPEDLAEADYIVRDFTQLFLA